MNIKVIHVFRVIFLLGTTLLIFSLFLKWYNFQMYNLDNELIASWSSYIFTGWETPFTTESTFNELMRPEATPIPFIMNILLIITLILSGYVLLFQNIEEAANIRKYYKFAYILGFLLMLVFFYIVISPVLYLIPYDMYFPLFTIIDQDAGFIYSYATGFGYILQVLSFPLIFPYSIFYFRTISTFIQQERTQERRVDAIIVKAQEALDLDRLIAEEETKQQLEVLER